TNRSTDVCVDYDLQLLIGNNPRFTLQEAQVSGIDAFDIRSRRELLDSNVVFRKQTDMLERECSVAFDGRIDGLIEFHSAAPQFDVQLRYIHCRAVFQ